MAEQKGARQNGEPRRRHSQNRPEVVLGFLGCMAQSRGRELIDKLPDVDLVSARQKFHRAADYLDDLFAGRREKVVDVAAKSGARQKFRQHLLNGAADKSVTGVREHHWPRPWPIRSSPRSRPARGQRVRRLTLRPRHAEGPNPRPAAVRLVQWVLRHLVLSALLATLTFK